MEFNGTLKEVQVVEGQDATFECSLSGPVSKITWCSNNASLEHGDKYDITVSEDMLHHKLVVKNCKPGDKGVYTAIAGIKSSKASLSFKGGFLILYPTPSTHNAASKCKSFLCIKLSLYTGDLNAHGKGHIGAGDEQAKLQGEGGAAASAAGLNGSGRSVSRDGIGDGQNKMGRDGMGGDGLGRDGLGKEGAGDGSGRDGSGKDVSGSGGTGDGLGKDGLGKKGLDGDGTDEGGSGGDGTGDTKQKKRIRDGSLVPDTIIGMCSTVVTVTFIA